MTMKQQDSGGLFAGRSSPGPAQAWRTAPGLAGALSAAAGALVLLGWVFDIGVFKSVLPQWVAMKANTALSFVLLGGALTALSVPSSDWSARAARLCAIFVGLGGLLSLVQYVSGIGLGIDQLLFREGAGAVATSHLGRMAPDTGLSFILIGAALWLMSDPQRSGRRLLAALLFSMLAGAIGLAAFVPYLIPPFSGVGWYAVTGMAVHTALLIAFLGLGATVLCLKQPALPWAIERRATAAFIFGLGIIVFTGLNISRGMAYESVVARRAADSRQMLGLVTHISLDLSIAQVRVRSYLTTGSELSEGDYRAAAVECEINLTALGDWCAGDPERGLRVAELRRRVTEVLGGWQQAVAARRKGGLTVEAREAVLARGRELVARTVVEMERLNRNGAEALLEDDRQEQHLHRLTIFLIVAGTGAGLAILLFALLQLNASVLERKRAGEALRSSEACLSLALETSHTGAWDLDLRDHRAHRTQMHDRIFGYETPLPSWNYEVFLEHVLPEDRPEVERSFGAAIAAHSHWDFECRIRRADGAVRWIRGTGGHERDPEGRPVRMSGLVRDVTEHKRTGAELTRLRKAIEGSLEVVFLTDREGIFTFVNPAFTATYGYAPDEVVGKVTPRILKSGEHPADTYRVFWESLLSGQEVKGELKNRKKDGTLINVEQSATAILDENQNLIGFLGIQRDITERKRVEAVLLGMQKLESLGTLAGGIAHDFNNILSAILGNLSLLQSRHEIAGEARELLEEALDACGTAKGLSHQLLTFAKGGAPVVAVMDLRPLLTQTARFATRGSNARCAFELGNSPLAVSIDKEQVAQVIQNLVINAQQAMPAGGYITVRGEAVTLADREVPPLSAGPYVRVTVQDKGTGIPPAHLSKIFDPYFSTKATGRGLGLAVCYSIVAKHGGLITVESKLGEGAVFSLYFPAANLADIPPEPKAPVIAAGSGRVLIMDDEDALSRMLKRMLERLGYQAEAVGDGEAALAAYQKEKEAGRPYDAVILDLTVPAGMGGLEAFGKLKKLDPQVKAIVSSGYSNDPVMSEWAAHGFAGVLEKPYAIEEVSEVLGRTLGNGDEA